jgi:poly(3-hydroxybutyrate) depolymerase
VVCTCFFAAAPATAQQIRPDPAGVQGHGKRAEQFELLLFTDAAGRELPFALFEPEGSSQRLPLVIVLHAENARRTNGRHLHGPARDLLSQPTQRATPCFVAAPVTAGEWTTAAGDEIDGRPMPADAGGTVLATMSLIEELVRTKNIDPARVYLVGTGIGGSGAIEIAARRPELIAAVIAAEPHVHSDAGRPLGDLSVNIVSDPERRNQPSQQTGKVPSNDASSPQSAAEAAAESLKAAGATSVTLTKAAWGSEPGREAVLPWLFRRQ